ncbi:transcriptional regulation complex subunit not5 [Vairimorpha apis BRL 01]|uniref:Transcriptional regulation complex subunit not5 n=1 Tax=Vairimorpha apis BRL 01 TaxID=1037528 RepID=T0L9E0_9MICR|nr:transcriptional regulation complex subunit not5 [Vairimorpha apis BRL 01]
MKKPILDKQESNKEKLTPEQIWKNASMILGTKKTSQEQVIKPVDLTDIKNRIQEITNERSTNPNFFKNELKNSLFHVPELCSSTVNKTNTLLKNKIDTPQWFPKYPLVIFNCPDIYKRLDLDTLFFIFYRSDNPVHQYYSATQLKLCSWRFHTKYLTWFQRLDEPKLITSDYERGDFLFFDYDVTWSFMKKSDFTFEYKYLECAEL